MANYPYTRDLPVANNDPGVDQPLMTQNTNSTDSLINEDHYSFGQNNGGFHKQVRMPVLAAKPTGLIGSSGTNYVKQVNNGDGLQAQEFYTNGASGGEYQITRTDNTNFPTFGLMTAFQYNAAPVINGEAGWTFLPGGLRLQYGTITVTSNMAYIVSFPINYSSVFTVLAEYQNNVATFSSGQLKFYNNSGFTFEVYATNGASIKQINWWAIGL